MSYLVANIPPIEVLIDKRFLYDFQKDEKGNYLGEGEWEMETIGHKLGL